MTEKRFEFYSDDYLVGIIDTVTRKKLNHFATIDLLNELEKERKKLKEENEQLKYRIEHLQNHNIRLLREHRFTDVSPNAVNNELVKENERLYHLKVLAHAFIVKKGLEGEFIKWSKENEISSLKKGRGD